MSDWFFNTATLEERSKAHNDRWFREDGDVIPLTVADPNHIFRGPNSPK